MVHFKYLLVIYIISKQFKEAVAEYQIKDITSGLKDLDDFIKKFDENFKDLQSFIQENLPLANSLDVKYLLFTPYNQDYPYNLNSTQRSLRESRFDPKLHVKFLVHGHDANLTFPNHVLFLIKDKILEQGDYNVIVVNYTKYVKEKYSTSVKNSYLVAKNIQILISFLMTETEIKSEYFHLIGHSLGANVVGNVGNMLPNIARITGLDPCGPLFQRFPPSYRISDKSAKFVDVIHSSSAKLVTDGFGLYFAVGHQDFYPNGGNRQPGCNYGKTYLNGNLALEKTLSMRFLLFCNHLRSEFLFAASISDCKFFGEQCDHYENFKLKQCPRNDGIVAEMGFHAKKIPGLPPKSKFYFNTSSKYPYCY